MNTEEKKMEMPNEYCFVGSFGAVFIPNSFMQASNFHACGLTSSTAQEISMKVVENKIVLSTKLDEESHFKIIDESMGATRTYKDENGKKITEIINGVNYHKIDELGRVYLPKKILKKIGVAVGRIVILQLVDEDTISIGRADS